MNRYEIHAVRLGGEWGVIQLSKASSPMPRLNYQDRIARAD